MAYLCAKLLMDGFSPIENIVRKMLVNWAINNIFGAVIVKNDFILESRFRGLLSYKLCSIN